MNKKVNNLVSLFAGFSALGSSDVSAADVGNSVTEFSFLDDVETASLNNGALPTYIAQHRSHSSHSSHSSHRSSSGGGYRTPSTPIPSSTPKSAPPSQPLSQPSRPSSTIPSVQQQNFQKVMSDADKRKNIILRVQLTLEALNFYSGPLDGVMGPATRKAVNAYRLSVGQKVQEKLDIEVLNSLGVLVQ